MPNPLRLTVGGAFLRLNRTSRILGLGLLLGPLLTWAADQAAFPPRTAPDEKVDFADIVGMRAKIEMISEKTIPFEIGFQSGKTAQIEVSRSSGQTIIQIRYHLKIGGREWGIVPLVKYGPNLKKSTTIRKLDSRYETLIEIQGVETPLEIKVVAPTGEITAIPLLVKTDQWHELQYYLGQKKAKFWSVNLSTGIAHIAYAQTSVSNIEQVDWTAKVSAYIGIPRVFGPPRWQFGGVIFGGTKKGTTT